LEGVVGMNNKKQCKYCVWAKSSNEDKDYASIIEMVRDDDYLVCTNVENIHSGRNINSGSNRLVSMDTDIKAPKVSFQVDDSDYCGAFKLNRACYLESIGR
jgi:hypothetical protein